MRAATHSTKFLESVKAEERSQLPRAEFAEAIQKDVMVLTNDISKLDPSAQHFTHNYVTLQVELEMLNGLYKLFKD